MKKVILKLLAKDCLLHQGQAIRQTVQAIKRTLRKKRTVVSKEELQFKFKPLTEFEWKNDVIQVVKCYKADLGFSGAVN